MLELKALIFFVVLLVVCVIACIANRRRQYHNQRLPNPVADSRRAQHQAPRDPSSRPFRAMKDHK